MELRELLEQLWNNFSSQNPSVASIHKLFAGEGEIVENDHIAFRTFDDKRIGIDVLAKSFLAFGYEPKGEYHFKEKKLHAVHFENKLVESAPLVFISELKLNECSPFLNEFIVNLINKLSYKDKDSDHLILKGNIWGTPSYKLYDQIRSESEYAAWLYVFGFRPNHFTVDVNSLKKYNTLEKVNEFLKQNGFALNNSGGEIKGSPEMLLEQSSTLSDIIEVKFTEGILEIPACYYEFARRYKDKNGNLYKGFHEKSADKIFESTNFHKKNK
jgi:hypothetical protein